MRGQDLRERSQVQRFVTKTPSVMAGLEVVVRVRHRHSDVAVFQAVQGTDYRRLHGDEARQHQDSHKSPPALPGRVVPGPGVRSHDKKLVRSSDSATDLWRSLLGLQLWPPPVPVPVEVLVNTRRQFLIQAPIILGAIAGCSKKGQTPASSAPTTPGAVTTIRKSCRQGASSTSWPTRTVSRPTSRSLRSPCTST
jgi:hypothetical protein